jgi:hypothetical protein
MFPDPSGLVAERVMKHRINISALSKVSLTINVPLILIVREVFLRAKHIIGDFERAKTSLTPNGPERSDPHR